MRIEANMSRLEVALKEVRQFHPIRGKSPDPPSDAILEEVRERLRICAHEKLGDLAYSFDTTRIMACLEILVGEREGDLAEKAGKVLRIRPRPRVISAGWFKLKRHYPHDLLEKVLRTSVEAKGFGSLAGLGNVSKRVPSWFVSARVSEGVFRDYGTTAGSGGLDDYLIANFIEMEDGLFRAVWRHLLARGNAGILHKEDPDRILLEYRKPENAKYVQEFSEHYLNTLQSRGKWDERILRFIEKKYDGPTDPDGRGNIETPFWQRVKPNPKKEFNAWLMLRHIDEFFEGERAEFWRRYVAANKVSRVKRILEGNGIMIDFGAFGVVEFKSVGNAAYIYPIGVFGALWEQSDFERLIGRFKDKKRTVRHRDFPGWDGRIIHSGDWPRETSAKIRKLLKL
jgi:hypothetical protein